MNEYQKYRKNWNEYPMKHIVSEFPLHLDIELTNRCNLTCPQCMYHGKQAIYKQKSYDLDFELFKQIIDEGAQKGLQAVKFGFSGEPLLYPRIVDAVYYAKCEGILDVQINSNATLLTESMCIDLIDCGLDLFILSDYGLKKQFENGKDLYMLKGKFRNPTIRIKTLEPIKWVRYSNEIVEHTFYDYNHPNEMNFEKSDFECPYPWQRLLVRSNKEVMKCSCGSIIPEKFLGRADILDIADLWTSAAMKFLRACHELHDTHIPRMCRMCPARTEYIKKQGDKN